MRGAKRFYKLRNICKYFPFSGQRSEGIEEAPLGGRMSRKGRKDKSFPLCTFDGQTDSVFGKAYTRPNPFKEVPRARHKLLLRLVPVSGLFALKIFQLPAGGVAFNNFQGRSVGIYGVHEILAYQP